MADIRCSNCGNTNPDFLDRCQFCQTLLRPESALHIGDEPTKKNTGELEEILPSWLRDARKQNKEDTGGDATLRSETRPKVQKNDASDLLAGLASQADGDDDEVPDWLAGINPVADKMSSKPSAKEGVPSDFFAQFAQGEAQQPKPPASEPAHEEVPAWMSGMEQSAPEPKDELNDWLSQAPADAGAPAFSTASGPFADDNSWMNNLGAPDDVAETPAEKEPEDLSWLHDLENSSRKDDEFSTPQKDAGFDFAPSSSGEDLSWLNNLGGASEPSFEQPVQPAATQPASSQEDLGWLNNLGGASEPSFEQPVPPSSSQEDLSWLNNLGGAAEPSFEQPVQPSSPQEDLSWLDSLGGTSAPAFEQPAQPAASQPASSQEDLSWLDNLGGTPAPSFEQPAQPAASQPASSQEDLGWLNNLGSTAAPSFEEPAQPVASEPASRSEDLSWLDNLGGTPAQPVTPQPPSASDDLSWLDNLAGTPASDEAPTIRPEQLSSSGDLDWLNNLGGTSAPAFDEPVTAQPPSSQDDLSWLSNLGGTAASAFEEPAAAQESEPPVPSTSKPFQTAPLNELLGDDEFKNASPDWLKSAVDEPSMPAPGELSMDWFSSQDKTKEENPAEQFDELVASSSAGPASAQPAFDLPLGESSTSASSDLDSLFDVQMPDWLSSQPEGAQTPQAGATAASGEEALAPVELPSWVQAMRPVASSIDDVAVTGQLDQVTEREGPLAGFRGVIPSAVIGSSLRPKAFSMKLQVSEEQEAGASLFEQILASETAVQPPKATSLISSQKMLRWVLSGVFVLVLALVVGLGSQMMPIAGSNQLSNLVAAVPDNSQVLVVIDYEPSFAGELEVTGGPLLDQLAQARRSTFNFISTSPNGLGLVDRLMLNTNISRSAPDGLGYQLGSQYFNDGFLPGGSAGVLGFIEKSGFEAIVLMTDNAETGRVWVEQFELAKSKHPEFADKPLFVVSSAQSAPMLSPYVTSGQADIVINGLYDAANYEYVNNTRPGIARRYWDAFGVGLFMAVLAIVLGSAGNILMGIRERRAQAEQG